MPTAYRLALALGALGLFAASAASAQTPNQPPPGSGTPNQPPPGWGTTPPAQPPPAAPPPPAAAPPPPAAAPLPAPAPAPYKEGEPPEQGDEGRIRVGFNLNAGLGTGNRLRGGTIGATFRVGYQIDHLMAVYGQVSPFVFFGGYTDSAAVDVSFSAISGFQFTPIFSLTPADIFEIAAGPSLDRLTGGSAGGSVTGTSVSTTGSAYSSFYFGVHGRAALHLGGKPNMKTGRRVGFSLGLDVHPTFGEGGTITFITIGLGADWY